MRRSAATGPLGRRVSPALRWIAVAATLGLILAEAASLHHRTMVATGAVHGSAVHGELVGAPAPDAETAELVAFDAGAGSDLAHEPCLLCQTSRDRLSALGASARWATGPADSSAAPPAELGELGAGAAIYAIAPKTSPPA